MYLDGILYYLIVVNTLNFLLIGVILFEQQRRAK